MLILKKLIKYVILLAPSIEFSITIDIISEEYI